MPKPAAIDTLPDNVRMELEQRLKAAGFGQYEELSQWLQSKGYRISENQVNVFGKEFKQRVQSLRLAREMAIEYRRALPEDDGAASEILTEVGKGLALSYAFLVQEALTEDFQSEAFYKAKGMTDVVATAARSIEAINRSDLAVKKRADEIREAQAKKFAELEEDAQKEGITMEFLSKIKSEILRIV